MRRPDEAPALKLGIAIAAASLCALVFDTIALGVQESVQSRALTTAIANWRRDRHHDGGGVDTAEYTAEVEDAAIFGSSSGGKRSHLCSTDCNLPRFVFPDLDDENENNNLYFRDNIAGMNASITRAVARGCLDGFPAHHDSKPIEISVVFGHDTPPRASSAFYVQYQMEQTTSPWFDTAYVRKLEGALSVWDFSPTNHGFLRALNELTAGRVGRFAPRQVHHVPMWLAIDGGNDATKYCGRTNKKKKPAPLPLCPVLYGRHAGDEQGQRCYPNAALTGRPPGTDNDPGTCGVRGWPPGIYVKDRFEEGYPDCPPPVDVLFFGGRKARRAATCVNVARAAPAHAAVGCFDDLVDLAAKERYVCDANVIFVEHAFEGAALEVHRINPLLARGKAVVAVRSRDAALDAQYARAVTFARDSAALPRAVARLLGDAAARAEAEARARAFVARVRGDVAPLCAALRTLGARALAEVARRRRDTAAESGWWWTTQQVLLRGGGDEPVAAAVYDVLPAAIPAAAPYRRRGAALLGLDAAVFVGVGALVLRTLPRWNTIIPGSTRRSHMV